MKIHLIIKAQWLILIPLILLMGCGSDKRTALDYLPVEKGRETKFESLGMMEGEKNVIQRKFSERNEIAGGVLAVEEQITKVHGAESRSVNTYEIKKNKVVRITLDFTTPEGSSRHTDTLFTVFELPGIFGKATWTNKGGDVTMKYSAKYGSTQTDVKNYPDCLVVDMESQKVKSPVRYRQYYAKDVGWVKTVKIDEKGNELIDPPT